MPPSKPRQKRKRNLETETEHADSAEKTPRRRRRRDDDDGSVIDHHHEVHVGLESDKGGLINGQDASLNGVPVARPSSAKIASSQPRPNRRPVAAASPTPASISGGRAPSVLQHMRSLAQGSMQSNNDLQSDCWDRTREKHAVNNESSMENNDAAACNQTILCDGTSHSTAETCDASQNFANAFDRERRKVKALLLFSLTYIIMILYAVSAVVYTQNCNHNLAILRIDAINSRTTQEQSEIIKREMGMHAQSRIILGTVREHLEHSQETVMQLKQALADARKTHKIEIQEYKAIFQQHDEELSDAVERIQILRGDKEDSAIDMAWLRMDELMEDNSELSNDLKKARKASNDIARVQLRDKELIKTVESLTRQLKLATDEKDKLLSHSKIIATRYDLLQHNHIEMSDAFFAPILIYTQNLQQSSEQQHSIILDLTSLIHSLHSSLEISRADLETQVVESVHAVDAIAGITTELAHVKTQAYEMERVHYMEHMEFQLERLEDEAMGAVQAVAEAAGKLEYERKLEEEGRWSSYVEEAESILGGIRENVQDGSALDKSVNVIDGISETSVLRAAISRRIEEGISSLRSYIHPYNYLKEREDGRIQTIESRSEE
mmetsp:Transcript_1480/g.3115  ORF Transcript_1480/g.3115 Transcript_1480/m.3115 type:complete len:610 (-) Transcript_1480:812-2641(-)